MNAAGWIGVSAVAIAIVAEQLKTAAGRRLFDALAAKDRSSADAAERAAGRAQAVEGIAGLVGTVAILTSAWQHGGRPHE